MLQRMIIFKFASTWDEMVKVAEKLFKEDLDRGQYFTKRARRRIIFDKWIVPRLTNPSVAEVLTWFNKNSIKLYSTYPPIVPPVLSDSLHHYPKFYPQKLLDIGAFTETFWMISNETDIQEVPKISETFSAVSSKQYALTDYVDDFTTETVFDINTFTNMITEYQSALSDMDITTHLIERTSVFFDEVMAVIELLDNGDFDKIKEFLAQTKELFRGFQGVRHIDFIGYKIKQGG